MNHKHGHPNQKGKNQSNVKQTTNQEFSSTFKFVRLHLGVWRTLALMLDSGSLVLVDVMKVVLSPCFKQSR